MIIGGIEEKYQGQRKDSGKGVDRDLTKDQGATRGTIKGADLGKGEGIGHQAQAILMISEGDPSQEKEGRGDIMIEDMKKGKTERMNLKGRS